jgi:hypothetical protein
MNSEVTKQAAPLDVSATSTETPPVEVGQGVETRSDSPAEHDAPDNSSPEPKTGKDAILEIVNEAVKPAESKPEAEEAAPKTDEPEAEVKAEDEETEALSQESRANIPNDQRPEWKSLTAIGDKLGPAAGKEVRQVMREIYRKEAALSKQVEQFKPAAEVVQEMRQSVGGSEQGFTNMRTLIRNFDSDPENAVPMLETLLQDARKRAGLVIQSPELLTESQELDQQVQDGLIDQQQADKRKAELLELQKSRTTKERTTAQQQTERDRQQRAQSEHQMQKSISEVNQVESNWSAAKAKNDPDFESVKSLHGAFARDNSLEFWNANKRLPNAKEATEILEKSLKQAKTEAGKFRPKPTPKTVVRDNNGSSNQHRQQPKNQREEIEQIIKDSLARE